MTRSVEDILNLITPDMKVDDIRNVVLNNWDFNVGNGTLLLYSGGVGDLDINSGYRKYETKLLTSSLANGQNVVDIGTTGIRELLDNNEGLDAKLFQAIENDTKYAGRTVENVLNGLDANGNRIGDGFWDDASRKLVQTHTGDYKLIMPDIPQGSVADVTEIPALLQKIANSGQKVNGVALQDWQAKYDFEVTQNILAGKSELEARSFVKNEINNLIEKTSNFELQDTVLGFDNDGKLHVDTDSALGRELGLNRTNLPDNVQGERIAVIDGNDFTNQDLSIVGKFSNLINKAGVVGTVLGTAVVISDTIKAVNEGDLNRAAEILVEFAGEISGGALSGWAASVGMAALLATPGVNVGVVAGMIIVAAGGVAGGYIGGTAGGKLFKDLYNDAVESGLIPQSSDNVLLQPEIEETSSSFIYQSDTGAGFAYLEAAQDNNVQLTRSAIDMHDVWVSNAEQNGRILNETIGVVEKYGAQFTSTEKVILSGGRLLVLKELVLADGQPIPENGTTFERQELLQNDSGELYVVQELSTVVGSGGNVTIPRQYRSDDNSNWVVRGDIYDLDGNLIKGDEYTVPSQDLQFALETAGGTLGSFLGNQLADGNKYQEIIYSSLFKTVGENFGSFAAFITENSFSDAFEVIFNGAPVEGTILDDVSFREDFFKNLNLKVSSVLGSVIFDEIGEALELDGFVGGAVTAAGEAITTSFVGGTIDVVFGDLDGTVFQGLADGSFLNSNGEIVLKDRFGNEQTFTGGIRDLALNAVGSYAGGYLAGKVISPEDQTAGLFGSLGSAYGAAVAQGTFLSTTSLGGAFTSLAQLGWLGGPMGVAIGAFVGTVIGTAFGNLFGEEEVPQAWATVKYDQIDGAYDVGNSWSSDGGDSALAAQMAGQVIQGVNEIIEISQGKLRSGEVAPNLRIGYEGNKLKVAVGGGSVKEFETSADAMQYAALKLMKDFDLVGGHMVVMRAWHNSDATNIYEWLEDIQVAEAFQGYLSDPTSILALMMNEPESELAQSWATILQRAAELELHLPHEKDLDGGWGEILLAQGVGIEFIPNIEGDTLTLTDPTTGEERVLHHIIGPGYEIVRIEGTDGDDIIEVIVDGPSITYVNGGEGDDVIEGSDQADVLVGGTGDDTINGNDGNDWLHGGAGNDTLDGGAGEDLVVGGEQDDILYGNTDTDHIYGNGGDDELYGNEGKDFLFGGRGNDILDGGSGKNDRVYGQEGDDILIDNDRERTYLYGGEGDDTFRLGIGSGSYVHINRNEGHDIVELSANTYYSYIRFAHNISMNELFYERNDNDLKIHILGENQSVLLKNFFDSDVKASIQINNGAHAMDNVNGHQNFYGYHDFHSTYFPSNIKAVSNRIASYDANLIDQLDTSNNILSDSVLATRQSWLKSNYGDLHRKITPRENYFAHAEVFGAGNNNVSFRNESSWSTVYKFGGAGNDTIKPANTSYKGTGFKIYGDSGDDKLYGAHNRDTIVGGLGDDVIYGRNHDDHLYGSHGNDKIFGQNHDDMIFGGQGDDELHGGAHDDNIEGEAGNDILLGQVGADVLRGGDGQDTISGGDDNDTIHGGEGDDIINGDGGIDTIFGDAGNDTIHGGDDDDWISGGLGNDTIDGGTGNDTAYGGEGDDTFIFDYSENTNNENYYYGEGGQDTLSLNFTAGEYSDLEDDVENLIRNHYSKENFDTYLFSSLPLNINLQEIENINVYVDGEIQNFDFSMIMGQSISDLLVGGDEDDLIFGDDGDDQIEGGLGNDFLVGGEGSDIIYAGLGDDRIYGGKGLDTVSFASAENYIEVNLSENSVVNDGQLGSDYIEKVENIIGSDHNDIIYDDNKNNTIHAGDGIDRIFLSGGKNIVNGGTGNDKFYTTLNQLGGHKLYGDEGNDYFSLSDSGKNTIDGGSGTNELRYSSSTGLIVSLENGEVDKNGDGSIDDRFISIQKFVAGTGDDIVIGSNKSDRFFGSAGNDILKGGAGSDIIYGQNNNDMLVGGSGDDYLNGGKNDDILSGQDGLDTLVGGTGSDIFVFEKATAFNDIDRIEDFNLVELDQIDISGLLEQYNAITDDIANFVQITDNGSDSFLSIDINGTGNNFVQIALISGVIGLSDVNQLEVDGALITNLQTPLIINGDAIAEDDNFVIESAEQLVGNVLVDNGNGVDHDADNDELSVIAETIASENGGSVTLSENGDFTYEAAQGFSGQDSFIYTLNDGNASADTGTVNITVSLSNIAPQAQSDVVIGNEDEIISGNVLIDNGNGIDSDPDGDQLSVIAETIITLQGASVSMSENGDFTYIPIENFNGEDSFSYTVQDSNGAENVGTVIVNVESVNDAPATKDDNFIDDEDQIITGNLIADNGLGQDIDLDGDSLSVVAGIITSVSNATVVISENGDFAYTPVSGFYGTDSFEYVLTDGNGEQAIGTVNITINEVLDSIEGTESNDVINGTDEAEIIHGFGGHDDILTGDGDDQVFGGEGNDEFIDQGGDDLYDGGAGALDQVNYSENETAIIADIESGTVDDDNDGQINDTLVDVEWVTATDYDDTVKGSAGIDRVYGGAGNDTMHGYASNDVLKGDAGDDVIHAGEGNDYIELGAGDDVAYGEAGNDNFHVTSGIDFIDGGAGSDTVNYIYHNHAVTIDLEAGTVDDNGDDIADDTLISIEKVQGSNFSDIIKGNSNNDDIRGNNGDDVIAGASGNDTLRGGNGDDTLIGGSGVDRLYGQAGADSFIFDNESVSSGIDTIEDFNFTDIDQIDVSGMLNGYDFGVDDINNFVRFVEEGSHSFLEVDADGTGQAYERVARLKNTIDMPNVSTLEADNILVTVGLSINNTPVAMDDLFSGDENQDVTGNVIVDNGNGVDSDPDGDTLSVIEETITSTQGGVVAILANGDFTYTPATDFFGADSFVYTLSDGNGGTATGTAVITINEVASTNEINGTTGNDVLNGTDGDDIINADAGNDNVYDGAGDDQVNGGAGNDTFYYQEGNDVYDGGEGTNDRVNYINATQGAIFDLRDGTIDLGMDSVIDDSTVNVESVTATHHDDIVHGNESVNKITALDGDNEVYGYAGNDDLRGGGGDDLIFGGLGNDWIYGYGGTNTLHGEGGADKFYAHTGVDTIDGGVGGDFVQYNVSQVAVTIDLENGTVDEGQDGSVEDTLISIEHAQGSNHDDIIMGASDNNSLYGRNGNDVIKGQDGNDNIYGGRHDDVLYGGAGADKLYGQQDSDIFVFESVTAFDAVDQIMDFKLSENDKIDLSDLLSQFDENTDNIIDFVQITESGSDSIISVDVDGGADNFVQIATIKNASGITDEEALKVSGNLVI